MTRIKVKQLIWDEWNIQHIKKHDVSKTDVEEIAKNIIVHKKAKEGRYLLIGRVGLRILSVVVKRKRTGLYYVVTARDAARKERRRAYEKEKKQTA